MTFIQELYNTFIKYKNKRAFCINDKDYSYGDFLEYINGARELIEKNVSGKNNPIGIMYFECIETYATIFAAWFSGNYFVPLNPKHPSERNKTIINNVGIQLLFSAQEDVDEFVREVEGLNFQINSDSKTKNIKEPVISSGVQWMYILTTSGSTGTPKHVPICQENLGAYCAGFLDRFPEMNDKVCMLQTYDLTVDASVTAYLVPLSIGACVYTLPDSPFKFLSIAKMLADKNVTWVKLTPSVLSFLAPHKTQLDFKHLGQVILGGEAFPLSLLKEWQPVFPNARIANHYGPTETTVGVTTYKIDDLQNIRSMNGVVSIGQEFKTVKSVIIKEDGTEAGFGENGELCISGKQVMQGYLNGNNNSFINFEKNNESRSYYRTGDIVQKDTEGFIYYMGRTDDQVKIEGHRINLIEIENKVRELLPGHKVAMLAYEKFPGFKRLYLFVEGSNIDKMQLKSRLTLHIPPKMIPEEIFVVSQLPLSSGGKKDRISLANDYLANPSKKSLK